MGSPVLEEGLQKGGHVLEREVWKGDFKGVLT